MDGEAPENRDGPIPDDGTAGELPLIRAARQAVRDHDPLQAAGEVRAWAERADPIPEQFGPYRIRRRISSGGMGAVYEAEQDSPPRTVAVKVVKPGELSERALRRFEHETRLLARLQHPGIAQIFDVGVIETAAGPFPFFSMEYVDGARLTHFAEARGLGVRERLALVAEVCDAVQYAHLKGIIHRDLKPANLLVDGAGRPKVLDFGVARATEADIVSVTMHTRIGEPVGTVPYMSPEQVAGDPDDIDSRTDVYSLGVVAYELLAGRLPLEVGGRPLHEAIRMICQEEPPALGTLDPALRGDVETVVATALAKDRDARYQSAAGLAADIRRVLDGEPILARRLGPLGWLWRWCRREPRVAMLAALSLLLLVMVAIGSTIAAIRLAEARRQVTALAERQRRSLHAAQMNLAMQAFRRNDLASVGALLETQRPAPGQPDPRGFAWRFLWRQLHGDLKTLDRHTGRINALAVSRDGHLLASAAGDEVIAWDTRTWAPRWSSRVHAATVNDLAFHPGGRLLAGACGDRTIALWDAGSGRLVARLRGHYLAVDCLAFSPDGRYLASGVGNVDRRVPTAARYGQVWIWDVEMRAIRHPLPEPWNLAADLAFSPDGRVLAVATWGDAVTLCDPHAKSRLAVLPEIDRPTALAYSPDGATLAVSGWSPQTVLWDVPSARVRGRLATGRVHSLAFSPDGRTLAAGGFDDQAVQLWDPSALVQRDLLRGHLADITKVKFSPDGRLLFSGGEDGTVKVWEAARHHAPRLLQGHTLEIDAMAMSRDGRYLATGSGDGTARLWDLAAGKLLATLGGHKVKVLSVAFSPDGEVLATGGLHDRSIILWRGRDGSLIRRLDECNGSIRGLCFSPDGRTMLAGTYFDDAGANPGPGELIAWDTSRWTIRKTLPAIHGDGIWSASFSPDGRLVATGGTDRTVRLWDASTWRPLGAFAHTGWVTSLAFSPDGRTLVAGSWDPERPVTRPVDVKLWDLAAGRERMTLAAHKSAVFAAAFSPDGTTLATGGGAGDVKLWDLVSGEVRGGFEMPQSGWVFGIAWTPDGHTLACTSGSSTTPGTVVLYEATPRIPAQTPPPAGP